MSVPANYRPAAGTVPTGPGVYRFRDEQGRVVYVGKARNLRNRLASYFSDINGMNNRTATMVTTATSVDWVTVSNEVEALQLEYLWIKEYEPRFNIRYRDDKSYPFLAVTLNEEFPRAMVVREAKKKGVRYFGPYAHAWAIRDTVDQLLRVFPMRTCSNGVFKRHHRMGRPCLLGDIGKCVAPCIGRVTEQEHRAIVDDLCDFLGGNTDRFIREIELEMKQASKDQDYESAARLRDDLGALRRALERTAIVLPEGTDADVIGLADDELEAAVQIFHVRGGRVTGQRGFVVERVEEVGADVLVEQLMSQLYGDGQNVPREVIVPTQPSHADVVSQWLTDLRGSRVRINVPARGTKKDLLATVARNAEQALVLHKLKRAGDLTARSKALQEIQAGLDLDAAPLRIECIDISSHHGTDVVASVVVFEDGLAKKSDYRRMALADHTDDVAAMGQAVSRHFKPLQDEVPLDERTRYRPGLLVVDGGAPQVNAAAAALRDLGLSGIPVCGLAKRLEEVWLPGERDPVILPRHSDGLYLLQRIRDEAHRFAITYHRKKRASRAAGSELDEIPGLGPSRRKALLKQFGSVRALRVASVDEVTAVAGIGPNLAAIIVDFFNKRPPPGGLNLTTGEILDHTDQL